MGNYVRRIAAGDWSMSDHLPPLYLQLRADFLGGK